MKEFPMWKLISVDNPDTSGVGYVGETLPFNFNGVQFFFGDLYSSRVTSIEVINDLMIVITRNTVYKFNKDINEQ